MIFYSALQPLLEEEIQAKNYYLKKQNGVPSFYERNSDGTETLYFSTNPADFLKKPDFKA